MCEEWFPLKGYEGLYEITKDGRLRKTPRELRLTEDANGYLIVQLADGNGKKKVKKVHRLVAETFIPNPENKPCVDHISCVRFDNRVDNLQWATQRENMNNPLTRIHLSKSLQRKET